MTRQPVLWNLSSTTLLSIEESQQRLQLLNLPSQAMGLYLTNSGAGKRKEEQGPMRFIVLP